MNILVLTNEIVSTFSEAIASVSQLVGDTGAKPYDIAFPNLGIFIETLRNNFRIGNFTIAYYGVIIAIGMLIDAFLVYFAANQHEPNDS